MDQSPSGGTQGPKAGPKNFPIYSMLRLLTACHTYSHATMSVLGNNRTTSITRNIAGTDLEMRQRWIPDKNRISLADRRQIKALSSAYRYMGSTPRGSSPVIQRTNSTSVQGRGRTSYGPALGPAITRAAQGTNARARQRHPMYPGRPTRFGSQPLS